jgi:DNA primase
MKITLDELEDYLESFHRYDSYAMACCVFHNDSSPSMLITENGYTCKSCGARGSLVTLYNKVSGRPVQPQKKVYNPSAFIWDRWNSQYDNLEYVCTVAHKQLKSRPELGEYLYKRKLTQCQIDLGTLGFLGGYYTFPIKDVDGKIQGAVARASPTIQTKDNRYSASKNCPVKLYVPNWQAVLEAKEIYVCFGTLDAWSLQMAGYPALTGISGQQFQAEFLDQFRKPIYIIADKREEKSAIHLQSRLGWRGRRLDIQWLEGTKDINDIHVKFGLEIVKEKIKEAKRKYDQ